MKPTSIKGLERKLQALKKKFTIDCPHCGRPILASEFASAAARRAAAMRRNNVAGPGRPRKLSLCPKCGAMLGVAETRTHKC